MTELQTVLYPALSRLPLLPAARLGQVATGCFIPRVKTGAQTIMLSVSPHVAWDTLTSLQVVLPGWYAQADASDSEKTIGSDTTYTSAYIEYPRGTFTQLKFSAANDVTIADGGQAISDALTIDIPRGAMFWVRVRYTNASGIITTTYGSNIHNGGKIRWGASGTDDADLITNFAISVGNTTSAGHQFSPIAIIAQTRERSFILLGDSIAAGNSDVWDGVGADTGILARSVGAFAPYINVAVGADRMDYFVTEHAKRIALADYCTDAIINYGVNDFTNSRSDAQMAADEQSIIGYFPANIDKKWITTITPVTTSTDSFATTANQTATATNSVRAVTNERRRLIPSGFTGCIDTADLVEAGRGSGIWSVTDFVPTADGTHPNVRTYMKVKASRLISPEVLA